MLVSFILLLNSSPAVALSKTLIDLRAVKLSDKKLDVSVWQVVHKKALDAKSRGRSGHIGFLRKVIPQKSRGRKKDPPSSPLKFNKKYTMSLGVHRKENLIF